MHVVMVHGPNTTKDCWNGLQAGLQGSANSITVVDLPGKNTDLDDREHLPNGEEYVSGISMDDYIKAITDAFPAGNARDVMLVGHAMGGNLISHVAAAHPERIAGLIYVAAMLPDEGQSGHDMITQIERDPMYHPRMAYLDYKPYFGTVRVVQNPSEPLDAKFSRTPEFEALNRAYIRCLSDRVIPATTQTEMLDMYEDAGNGTVMVTLKDGHFPQYENYEQLRGVIQSLIADITTAPDPRAFQQESVAA